MRPNQNKNRQRNRNGGRKHLNPLSRNFESTGPDVKVRGNAAHIAEKYLQLARDAQSSGDSVMAENYLQHAEHYFRIVAAAQAQMNARFEGQPIADDDFDDDLPDMNSRFASPQQVQQQPQQVETEDAAEGERAEGQNQQPQAERQERGERNDRRRDRRERRDRDDRGERPAEQQPQQDVAAAPVADAETAVADSATAPQDGAEATDGEVRKPRRPRRRRQPGGGDGESGDAPSELPAFLTSGANAAE